MNGTGISRRFPVKAATLLGRAVAAALEGNAADGMRRHADHRIWPLLPAAVMVMAVAAAQPGDARANPVGGRVAAGAASISAPNARTVEVLQTSPRAIIEWQGFSIAADETTRFLQPSSSSVVLNRVTGGDPSRILGSLSANGQVLLVNGSGILFGPTARIDVAGLVASTADIRNDEFMAGRMKFDLPGRPGATVVNQGDITVADRGLVALVAPGVENAGRINARLGRVVLASGERHTVDLFGDGLVSFLAADVLAAAASGARVGNSGEIIADGGIVSLAAAAAGAIVDNAINVAGVIQARTAENRNGVIMLEAGGAGRVHVAGRLDASGSGTGGSIGVTGGTVELAGSARLDASGDAGGGSILVGGGWQGGGTLPRAQAVAVAAGATLKADAIDSGNGGTVVLWSDGATGFAAAISARGGSVTGDGGSVEVSGKRALGYSGTVDTRAPNGRTGLLLLDPRHAVISAAADGGSGDTQTINAATLVAGLGMSNITISADESITVNAAVNAAAQTNANTLHFADADGGGLRVNFNAPVTLGANQRLTGEANIIHVAAGGRIGNGVDVAGSGATVNIAAGDYAEQVTLNKAGMTVAGAPGAHLGISAGQTGFNVAASNVTIRGMTVTGPYGQGYADVNWNAEPGITSAVTVQPGIAGATIENNTIRNTRTGVLLLNGATGSVTGNTIDNTKGSILIRADGVTVSGNSRGSTGSEWDIVFLNNISDGAYFTSPHVSQSQYGAGVMAMSADNGGMHVLDRRYGSNGLLGSTPQFGNRSHIVVSAGSNFTAVDDFNLGNGLGNARQPLGFIADGINTVVAGGTVSVIAGNYAESLAIGKALTLRGAGPGLTVVDPVGNTDGILVSGNIGAGAAVTIAGLTVQGGRHGIRVADATVLGTITLDGLVVRDNASNGFISSNGGSGPGTVATINILDSVFAGNGSGGGSADINLFRFNGDALLRNVDILGTRTANVNTATDYGLQIRGHGDVDSVTPSGAVTLDGVRIAGSYRRAHLGIQRYSDASGVTMDGVVLGGALAAGTGNGGTVGVAASQAGWSTFFSSDMRGNLDLGDTQFAGGSLPFGDIRIGGETAGLRVDATRSGFSGITRSHAVSGAENFAIENRITHVIDDASTGGLVTWQAGNLYVTPESGSIRRGLDAAVAGNTVNVAAGSYPENLLLTTNLTLAGSGVAVAGLGSAAGTVTGLSGSWHIGGPVNFAGIVELAGGVSLDTSAANGAMTFNGAILGRGAGGQALSLDAGSGMVTVHNIGSAATPLGSVTVRAGDYAGAAGTAYVAALDINAADVAVGNSTVNATGSVTIHSANLSGSINAADIGVTATGNVTGNITATSAVSISGGNVQGVVQGANVQVAATGTANATVIAANLASVSGADVQGSVSGANVQVAATGTANTVVVATGTASISGANVQGSVQAPSATVVASQSVNINADIGNLTLSAQSGSISGHTGTVQLTGGSGAVAVNGETAVAADSGVIRSQSLLNPDVQGGGTYAPQVAASPAAYAFGASATDVFALDFALGVVPASGVASDLPAGLLGNFWGGVSAERDGKKPQ